MAGDRTEAAVTRAALNILLNSVAFVPALLLLAAIVTWGGA